MRIGTGKAMGAEIGIHGFLHGKEMGQMNEVSNEFKQWLFEEGRAGKTIASYVGDVVGFQRYLEGKAVDSTQLLSRFSFVRYKQHLIDEDFAIVTINKKINSLKVYNDFLVLKGLVQEACIQLRKDQVKIAAGSEQIVEALTDE
jgi:integrase/recombinase XerD